MPPESAVKHRRRQSDDVFRDHTEHARDDGKDSGSHSGSDSGMGFSETASEHNLPAVIPIENDVTGGVTADVITTKRTSQVLDPRMYLEASYTQDTQGESDRDLNPSDYLNQSTAIPQHSTKNTPIPENPKVYQNKPSTSKDHPSKSLKKHYWEILEEPTNIPQSPEEIQYAPSPQKRATLVDQKRLSFRGSKKVASIMPMNDSFMDNDPNVPIENPSSPNSPGNDDPYSKPSDSEVM